MKKLLAITIILTCISCEKSPTDFRELTGLTIGANFNSLPTAKTFTKVMDGEYNQGSYKLPDKIGTVSDLNVTTMNGKISEVKFSTNEETNIPELEKSFEPLTKKTAGNNIENELGIFKSYQTPDKKTILLIIEHKSKRLKNGKPVYDYRYSNPEAIKESAKLIQGTLR